MTVITPTRLPSPNRASRGDARGHGGEPPLAVRRPPDGQDDDAQGGRARAM